MGTTALYLDTSNLKQFEATVVAREPSRVQLDQTAFYPTGGGQPHDTGELSSDGRTWQVVDVTGRGEIWHHVEGDPPREGTHIEGRLDWDRRFAHMRYHTAQHLLSAVLLDEYDAETTGNQLYTGRARIDCAYDRFDDTDLEAIEDAVNVLIEADRSVEWYELDRETAEAELDPSRTRLDLLPPAVDPIRIVEIDGVDRTACAGTHVERTGLVEEFTVTGRETAGRGAERIRFILGDGPNS